MAQKKVSRREEWLKLRISHLQLLMLIIVVSIIGIFALLVYFDKISYVIEWRLGKTVEQAENLIERAKEFGAVNEEIDTYQEKLNTIKDTRQEGGSILVFRNDLNKLIEELNEFIAKLQAFKKGYLAEIVQVVREVTVNLQNNLSWEKAKKGLPLNSGDKVKTGIESRAEISTESGNVLRVNPESMIIIKDLSRDRKTFTPREVYSITESPNADYHIRTRRSDVVLEDEYSSINVQKQSEVKINKVNRNATISVYRGLVEVQNKQGETKEVRTREALSINKKGLFQETIKIPYPPGLIEPQNLKYFRFTDAKQVKILLRWSKQKGINTYLLKVATDLDFNKIIVDKEINGLTYTLSDLDKGNYFWSVASKSTFKTHILSEFASKKSFLISFSQASSQRDITPATFEWLNVKPFSNEGILVEGKTEPGARLVIEDISITVNEDGSFRDIIPLENAKNIIELQLYDNAGNVYRKKVSLL